MTKGFNFEATKSCHVCPTIFFCYSGSPSAPCSSLSHMKAPRVASSKSRDRFTSSSKASSGNHIPGRTFFVLTNDSEGEIRNKYPSIPSPHKIRWDDESQWGTANHGRARQGTAGHGIGAVARGRAGWMGGQGGSGVSKDVGARPTTSPERETTRDNPTFFPSGHAFTTRKRQCCHNCYFAMYFGCVWAVTNDLGEETCPKSGWCAERVWSSWGAGRQQSLYRSGLVCPSKYSTPPRTFNDPRDVTAAQQALHATTPKNRQHLRYQEHSTLASKCPQPPTPTHSLFLPFQLSSISNARVFEFFQIRRTSTQKFHYHNCCELNCHNTSPRARLKRGVVIVNTRLLCNAISPRSAEEVKGGGLGVGTQNKESSTHGIK